MGNRLQGKVQMSDLQVSFKVVLLVPKQYLSECTKFGADREFCSPPFMTVEFKVSA